MRRFARKPARPIAHRPLSSRMLLFCNISSEGAVIHICISRSDPPLFILHMRSGDQSERRWVQKVKISNSLLDFASLVPPLNLERMLSESNAGFIGHDKRTYTR